MSVRVYIGGSLLETSTRRLSLCALIDEDCSSNPHDYSCRMHFVLPVIDCCLQTDSVFRRIKIKTLLSSYGSLLVYHGDLHVNETM